MCMSRLYQVVRTDHDTGSELIVRDLDGRESKMSLLAYEGPSLESGDWLVAQSGFALAPADPEDAATALAELETLGPATERQGAR